MGMGEEMAENGRERERSSLLSLIAKTNELAQGQVGIVKSRQHTTLLSCPWP